MRMKIVGLLVVLLALCIAVDARNPLPENSVVVLTCAGFSDVSEMVEILRTNSFEPILVDDNRLPPIIEDDHLMVKNLVIHGITHLENRPKNFPNLLLQFLIKGGNIIWALGDFNTKSIFYKDLGEFLSQVGLKIHSGNLVAQESLERGLFASTLRIPEILGKDMIEKPFMFKSPGFIVSQESKKREFDLTYPLATLPRNSGFSVCTNKGVRTDVIPGLDAHLVTLFQSRTDSRMSIFSHKELLENSFLSLKDRSNRLVFEKLVNWSFKRTNTLEVDRMDIFYSGDVYSNHTHTCSGSKCSECRNDKNQIFIGKYEVVKDAENNIKKVFRVRDKVQIRLKIDESFYDSMSGRFVKIPFRKKEYIDISLNMLDPQRSIRLMRNPDTSQFWNYLSEDVNLPDRVGIYKLCLSLFHKGFTFIEHERLFVVRHFHYDEYERLLLRSLPYYITVLNMSIGFFVLLFVLLYVGEKQIKKNRYLADRMPYVGEINRCIYEEDSEGLARLVRIPYTLREFEMIEPARMSTKQVDSVPEQVDCKQIASMVSFHLKMISLIKDNKRKFYIKKGAEIPDKEIWVKLSLIYVHFLQELARLIPSITSNWICRFVSLHVGIISQINEKIDRYIEKDVLMVLHSILNAYLNDRNPDTEKSKKIFSLYISNAILRIYLNSKNQLILCNSILTAIDNVQVVECIEKNKYLELSDNTKKSIQNDLRRFAFIRGKIHLLNEKLENAEAEFNLVSEQGYFKELVHYMVPLKLLKEMLPSQSLLERFSLQDEYKDLISSIKKLDIKGFRACTVEHGNVWRKRGTMYLFQKVEILIYKNLFKSTYKTLNLTKMPIRTFEIPLGIKQIDMEYNTLELILAVMIDKNLIRGYLSHEKGFIILSQIDPFPKPQRFFK